MLTKEKEIRSRKNNLFRMLYGAGISLLAASAMIFFLIFYPLIGAEVKYSFSDKNNNSPVAAKNELQGDDNGAIVVADADFGIVIPKIGANAKVIAEVDWRNSQEYQRALAQGVAHAKGTALPGSAGNVFIFAHSGGDFYQAARYNAVFYLLSKLESGDNIYLFYGKNKLTYRVTEKKTAQPEEINYLEGDAEKKTLTLMTCWPAGTALKRLVIIAEQEE